MKNLIIKTLFISLLLSTVIFSGIQANFKKILTKVWNNSVVRVTKNTWDIKGVRYSIGPALVASKPLNVSGKYKSYSPRFLSVESNLFCQREERKLPENLIGKLTRLTSLLYQLKYKKQSP